MRIRMLDIALIAGVLMLPCALAGQTQASWIGSWEQVLTESTDGPGSTRYIRVTTRIAPWDDGLKVTYDMVGPRGGRTHVEWIGRFDGRDYTVQGVDYVLTNAYNRIDDHSYQIVVKVDGALAATTRVVVSTDGQVLTAVTTETDAQGQTADTTAVYHKQ